jgi:hypothetical protein
MCLKSHDKATLVVIYGNNVEFIREINNCHLSIIIHSLTLMSIFDIAIPGKEKRIHVCIFHYVMSCDPVARCLITDSKKKVSELCEEMRH